MQEQSSGSCRGGDVDAAMDERQQTNSTEAILGVFLFLRKMEMK